MEKHQVSSPRTQQGTGSNISVIKEMQRDRRNQMAGDEIVNILRRMLLGLKEACPQPQ